MQTKKLNPGGWLFKEEPSHYSYDDLERDKETVWDGVENNLAKKNLRQVKPGDRVLFYHTGKERAIVGEMQVLTDALTGVAGSPPTAVAVKVKAVRRWPTPVTLERIKREPLLQDWDLVRLPRLSVMAVSPRQWQRLEELGGL